MHCKSKLLLVFFLSNKGGGGGVVQIVNSLCGKY